MCSENSFAEQGPSLREAATEVGESADAIFIKGIFFKLFPSFPLNKFSYFIFKGNNPGF